MKNLKTVLALMLVLSATWSCKKGDAGPQGEPGPKGNQGEAGSANVKVFTKDISNAQWTVVGNNNSGYLVLDISAPQALTQDVVNNWTTLVYVSSSDFSSNWALLPYYTERNIRVTATLSTGHLVLKRDQDGKPSTQSNFSTVKLITIKPSETGALQYSPAGNQLINNLN